MRLRLNKGDIIYNIEEDPFSRQRIVWVRKESGYMEKHLMDWRDNLEVEETPKVRIEAPTQNKLILLEEEMQ